MKDKIVADYIACYLKTIQHRGRPMRPQYFQGKSSFVIIGNMANSAGTTLTKAISPMALGRDRYQMEQTTDAHVAFFEGVAK